MIFFFWLQNIRCGSNSALEVCRLIKDNLTCPMVSLDDHLRHFVLGCSMTCVNCALETLLLITVVSEVYYTVSSFHSSDPSK